MTEADEEWQRKLQAFQKLPPNGTDFADFTKDQWDAMREFLKDMKPGKAEWLV